MNELPKTQWKRGSLEDETKKVSLGDNVIFEPIHEISFVGEIQKQTLQMVWGQHYYSSELNHHTSLSLKYLIHIVEHKSKMTTDLEFRTIKHNWRSGDQNIYKTIKESNMVRQIQFKEIEENSRMGKTRDFLKKIRDTKGTFHTKMGSIKDRKMVWT